MTRPGSKTEFFYTDVGLVAVDSPVKLQILNLLKEDPRSFDEIVKHTSKAKSTISVHLNNLQACELVVENVNPDDRRRKIYSLNSQYIGCSQKPVIEHYNRFLERLSSDLGRDKFHFLESIIHALYFGFEAYGIDNGPILKKIGIDIGKNLSFTFGSTELESLLAEIASFLELRGKRKVSVVKNRFLGLLIEDKLKAESIVSAGKTFCSFEEGILEGLLREKLGKEYAVKEAECYGTGHGHCLFIIKE